MSLATPAKTIAVLKQFNLYLTKSLGQNFLVDENILNKIGDLAGLNSNDIVLEVGPGIGTLTQLLASKCKKVIAIEYDKRFIEVLSETLSPFKNVTVFHSNAMEFDFSPKLRQSELPNKLVSNLPYNIAAPLIVRYLQKFSSLTTFVVMVQKEVAMRMMAEPSTKEYSSFTIAVQYYCHPSYGFSVSRNVFIPPPNVDSAVVKLERLSEPRIEVKNEALLFSLIRAAFGQRRKTIRNALAGSGRFDKDKIELVLKMCDIDPSRRGETLSLEAFGALCNTFEELDLS